MVEVDVVEQLQKPMDHLGDFHVHQQEDVIDLQDGLLIHLPQHQMELQKLIGQHQMVGY